MSEGGRRRLTTTRWLDAGVAITLMVGLLFNLAQAVAGDGGWPVQQPWRGVRFVLGTLFVVFALARVAVWIAARTRSRRKRPA